MSENTKIEWCDHTFNPWEGCQKVGPGCDHCYAETRNARFGGGQAVNWGPGAPRRRTSVANWRKPLQWEAKAAEFMALHGRRQRVFCASLADVFDNDVPAEWRRDLFNLILSTPSLDWLLLTKRIGNAARMIEETLPENMKALPPDCPVAWPWPNVWIGATIVNQAEADRDIPKLLSVPASVRFLSMEPLLGPVDLTAIKHTAGPGFWGDCLEWYHRPHCVPHMKWPGLDWVIVGGESGPGARPMHPEWARSLRDQCQAAGVPFLFKQWGEWGTAARSSSTGVPVFRQFPNFQTWVNKASTWVQGGICLDTDGRELKIGGDMMRARDEGKFPVTIMHKVGKKDAGRLLDGVEHNGFPGGAS